MEKILSAKYLLLIICVVFFITRLYKISEVPPSLYWDEASISYNAYSIATTLKDEWGRFLPLHFQAFGEFKLPVFIYSSSIIIKLFGNYEWVIRVVSVLFSLFTIIITYLLYLSIFKDKAGALISSFLLSIYPWFFIFSRTGYEATAGLMFYLLGTLLFLKSNFRYKLLVLSLLSFIASMYSYNSFRLITPPTLILLLVLFFNKQNIPLKKKIIAISLSVLLISLSFVPIVKLYKYQGGLSRYEAVSIINPTKNLATTVDLIISNYLSHFSPQFLFIRGDKNLRSHAPNSGELFILDLPLLILGLFYIFKKKELVAFLPFLFMLISPIAASITKESPHALRSISIIPFVAMISSQGLTFLSSFFKIRKNSIIIFVVFLYCLFFINYMFNFFVTYKELSSQAWQYGYKEMVNKYGAEFKDFNYVIISDYYAQPHIFLLYYLNFDPIVFRQTVEYSRIDDWGFSTVKSFSNFVFEKEKDIKLENIKGKTLIFKVNPDLKIKAVDKINFLDGNIAFWVYKLNE